MEDEDITGDCGGEKTMSSTMDGGLHSVDRPWNPSDSEQPRTLRGGAGIQEEKSCSCLECGKCFTSISALVVHQRSHIGEKLFPCIECRKCFSTKYSLLSHQRLHTGEKPHVCSACGKCYRKKSQLKRHHQYYKGEEQYSCSKCGKCFSQKCGLNEHLKCHTDEKPYCCFECGKSFSWMSDVTRHHIISHMQNQLFPGFLMREMLSTEIKSRQTSKISQKEEAVLQP
ncbi:oocyte zinc finger protein XlCOF15-like [Rana temporaria]|uniref:oocyte zinc finger protein XlCOF15-like n=1 Tax=Rana temporaria TaxID=8407 RepID=UPI001AAD1F99|nr:oocyte zinc finger protein XlCOF15-like [Rana temporaria]